MRGDDIAARRGSEASREHRCYGGDETIGNYRDPERSTTQNNAHEPGDLEAPELREHIEPVVGARAVDGDCTLDDVDLPKQGDIVDACTSPRALVTRAPGHARRQRARGGRVADAHVSDSYQPNSVSDEISGHSYAGLDRLCRRVATHRRPSR